MAALFGWGFRLPPGLIYAFLMAKPGKSGLFQPICLRWTDNVSLLASFYPVLPQLVPMGFSSMLPDCRRRALAGIAAERKLLKSDTYAQQFKSVDTYDG